VYGFGVVGGDIFVNEFYIVLGKELLNVVDAIGRILFEVFLHHQIK
jgi:hypothetical protein